ncbi:Uncharacterised protein [Vibrio cholerae]|nr:Uncharacterised protein [Vibrio cholerae]CSI58645.1 Uncharacterised protein [Vibrio cholerae]
MPCTGPPTKLLTVVPMASIAKPERRYIRLSAVTTRCDC